MATHVTYMIKLILITKLFCSKSGWIRDESTQFDPTKVKIIPYYLIPLCTALFYFEDVQLVSVYFMH
jgi:hypothetical protein